MRDACSSRVARSLAAVLVVVSLIGTVGSTPVGASTISPAFRDYWAQTDQATDLPLVWGPEAYSEELNEAYQEAPGGYRLVQYFDKGRLELGGTSQSPQITSGLLATEMITGKVQTGNAQTRYAPPAKVAVAGDPTNIFPTYAQLDTLRTVTHDGQTPFTRLYNPNGSFGVYQAAVSDPAAAYGDVDSVTGHALPKAFLDFRNDPRHPLATVGLAITEPVWANVTVGGVKKYVLIQAFERRVLTYTPSNPDPYKVEFGNIGQHYYKWRYSKDGVGDTPIVSGVAPNFRAAYGSGNNPGLGKPLVPNATAEDSFAILELQNGYMLYVGSTKKIYVMAFDHRTLSIFDDTYQDGADDPGGKPGPNPGQVEPSKGFGKVWRANPSVQLAVGYARGPERGFTGTYQPFEHGYIYFDPDQKYFWMVNTQANLWGMARTS